MIVRLGAGKYKLSAQAILVTLILLLFFFQGYFIDLGVSKNIKYILDIFNILLFCVLLRKKRRFALINTWILVIYIVLVIIGSVVMLANSAIWETKVIFWGFGCRNLLRFPLFFVACNELLTERDIENIFKIILVIHPFNTAMIIYQYFTVEVWAYWMRGDNLNGFFGTKVGGNQYLNVFLLAVTMIAYSMWRKKKIGLKWVFLSISMCLLDAALAELKVYFVEIVLVFILFWIAEKRWKRISSRQILHGVAFLVIACIALYFMIQLLYRLYPIFSGSLTLENIIKILSDEGGYTGEGDLNRLNAVSGVFRQIFKGNIVDGLFGLGIGSAYSGGEMTKFANMYFDTHYSWFSSSYLFVETGFVGLALYVGSFLYLYRHCDKGSKYEGISKVMSIMALVLIIYDEVLKTEGGYLIFFLLASGVVVGKPRSDFEKRAKDNGPIFSFSNHTSI